MATFQFTNDQLEKLSIIRPPPRFDTVVLAQSVPAGTQVPKGTVIEVRIGFSSWIKLADISSTPVPDALKDATLADLNDAVAAAPDLGNQASDPGTFADTGKKQAFVNKLGGVLGGKTLNIADAQNLGRLVKTVIR